ncbi:uracil-DNA glycosylase family protein [Cystobacter fuscus]
MKAPGPVNHPRERSPPSLAGVERSPRGSAPSPPLAAGGGWPVPPGGRTCGRGSPCRGSPPASGPGAPPGGQQARPRAPGASPGGPSAAPSRGGSPGRAPSGFAGPHPRAARAHRGAGPDASVRGPTAGCGGRRAAPPGRHPARAGDCRRCKLCTGRKNIVFGSGNPRAELVFVGEGPGETEDQQGVPFVGAAGQLLTKMIEAMGYRRDDIYICNVVKCRPPGNRNPEPDEVAACEPFLRAQLKSIQPKAIVALGKFAAQTLLRDSTPITRLRGTGANTRASS